MASSRAGSAGYQFWEWFSAQGFGELRARPHYKFSPGSEASPLDSGLKTCCNKMHPKPCTGALYKPKPFNYPWSPKLHKTKCPKS